MQVHQLVGTGRKRRKRVGRGLGSRRGTYSTRGVKGQKARAGARIRPGFAGGQTPLYARLPKRRGFQSPHPKAYPVNVGSLGKHFPAGSRITRTRLVSVGLVPKGARRVKLLGDGDLTVAVSVQGIDVSGSARKKIEQAGGSVNSV